MKRRVLYFRKKIILKLEEIVTPLFFSHHYPEEYYRCVRIGKFHFCRRCVFLYPLTFLVLGLSFTTYLWPVEFDPFLLLLLPIPATIEFSLEQLKKIPYRPKIQILTTLLLAPALGKGLGRYLLNQTDLLFWGMTLFYGGLSGMALFYNKVYLSKEKS